MQADETDIAKRLLPRKMEIWRRKRNILLERKAMAKAKRIKEWVCTNTNNTLDCVSNCTQLTF